MKMLQFGYFPFEDVVKDCANNKVRYAMDCYYFYNFNHEFLVQFFSVSIALTFCNGRGMKL